MKLALVHDHLNQIGGAERVVLELHKVWPAAKLHTLLHDEKNVRGFFGDLKIIPSFLQNFPFSRSHLRWYLPLMPAAIESLPMGEYDVILSSASAFGKGAIAAPNAVHICYCHTPTRYLWSDANSYLTELPKGWLVKKILPVVLTRLREWDRLAAGRVDYFVANSKFVAERIRRYYDQTATVIYPPVDVSGYPNIPKKDYFILVSRLRPYKKVDLVIKAFNRLNMPLMIVGSGEEAARLKRQANGRIIFAGNVSDARKKELLAGSLGFIHPQEEDFGISAVEAMAAGTPVIAFNAGGARETVVDGQTGLFFEEQTWQSLADAVIRFKRKSFDYAAIRAYAQKFSEERFRREMREFVERKYNERKLIIGN